ncbi:MAG: MFS transporter [Lachnospiraceae bacterium]|nr:MFS transporter [Lachnospiraceae bacterium]
MKSWIRLKGTRFHLVLLIVSFLFYNNVTLVIVLMSVAMFGYGITYACMPALFGDTIVYSEWKTGKNATGWNIRSLRTG